MNTIHFEKENYSPVNSDEALRVTVIERNYFKLAKKIELNEWENVDRFLIKSFREIVQFIQISYPDDRRDP